VRFVKFVVFKTFVCFVRFVVFVHLTSLTGFAGFAFNFVKFLIFNNKLMRFAIEYLLTFKTSPQIFLGWTFFVGLFYVLFEKVQPPSSIKISIKFTKYLVIKKDFI
jgi:hypothetical protein